LYLDQLTVQLLHFIQNLLDSPLVLRRWDLLVETREPVSLAIATRTVLVNLDNLVTLGFFSFGRTHRLLEPVVQLFVAEGGLAYPKPEERGKQRPHMS